MRLHHNGYNPHDYRVEAGTQGFGDMRYTLNGDLRCYEHGAVVFDSNAAYSPDTRDRVMRQTRGVTVELPTQLTQQLYTPTGEKVVKKWVTIEMSSHRRGWSSAQAVWMDHDHNIALPVAYAGGVAVYYPCETAMPHVISPNSDWVFQVTFTDRKAAAALRDELEAYWPVAEGIKGLHPDGFRRWAYRMPDKSTSLKALKKFVAGDRAVGTIADLLAARGSQGLTDAVLAVSGRTEQYPYLRLKP